jgi:hypothetical protein
VVSSEEIGTMGRKEGEERKVRRKEERKEKRKNWGEKGKWNKRGLSKLIFGQNGRWR